jgi:methionyl-tRNA synthetase
MKRPFYVTTPIYYINDVPHLGSAYTTIAADVLARYQRLRGREARFLTGTDEHGLKIQRVADERGVTPQALADAVSATFQETWPRLGCAPDDFIRTSEERHQEGVQALWRQIQERGDIYLGHYEGLYCVGCEAYYTEKELTQPGNVCPLHGKPAEVVKEESYFFRLSAYGEKLLKLYEEHPTFVQPATRLNEVKSFVREGLQDLSISRTTFQWGVPVPNDPRHVMYVWFDALSNYVTALAKPVDNKRFWPASVHLVGKDILRFHAVYWPAMLMAAGLELPEHIFAHGFLTYGGQKMSKSLRNTVSPVALAEAISPTVGVDTVRYCLMRAISFGQDGDFSIQDVITRYGSELGNALGNLLNRVLPFAESVPAKAALGPLEVALDDSLKTAARDAADAFDANNPTRALEAIWTVVVAANAYVDRSAPWAAKKSDPARLGTIVATLVELLEAVSIMIAPVMPTVAALMRAQLGADLLASAVGRDQWPFTRPVREPGGALYRGEPIFPRLEKERERELIAQFSPPVASDAGDAKPASPPAPPDAKPTIEFADFQKLDLRLGTVLSAERVKKKDKLLDLRVDMGDGSPPRRIIAGLAATYTPDELIGRQVVVLANLAPREFGKGLVSEGMILAADAGGRLRALMLDPPELAGTPVR